MSEPRVGQLFGRYRIEAVLGRGGMGVVYRAFDTRLERTVALKTLGLQSSADPEFRNRFLRESRLLARLDHPHIVPVYDADEVDGELYLAMRFVDGNELATLVSRSGGLEPERAVDLIAQVADALDTAHAAGLVHRDVKPANILVEQRRGGLEHAYLADFGLTKPVAGLTGLTQAGIFVGTLGYVAPEQIDGKAVDHRADIYALGCVLYLCLTGQEPYPRDTTMAALWAHLREPAPRPTELRHDLGAGFDDVVAAALAKAPEDRYASAGALAAAARGALQGAPRVPMTEASAEGLAGSAPSHAAPPVTPTVLEDARAPLAATRSNGPARSESTIADNRLQRERGASPRQPVDAPSVAPAQAPARLPQMATRRPVLIGTGAIVSLIVVVAMAVAVSLGNANPRAGSVGSSPPSATASSPPAATQTGPPTSAGATAPASQPVEVDVVAYPQDGVSACELQGYRGRVGLIRAVGDFTVEFHLCQPDAAFLARIASPALAIQEASFLENGGGRSLVEFPNGTGPYRMASWAAGEEIALEAHERYWGDPALTPNATIRWTADPAQRLLELQSGAVDAIDSPNLGDLELIASSPAHRLVPGVPSRLTYLGMDNTASPWNLEPVRQAIAMGIDRDRIVESIFPPGSTTASHFAPCAVPFGCGGESWYAFDPARARELLTEAGYADGFSTTIELGDLAGEVDLSIRLATELQAQLQEHLGITAEIVEHDQAAYAEAMRAGELDGLLILHTEPAYLDVAGYLDPVFGRDAAGPTRAPLEDVWSHLEEGSATTEEAGRTASYADANDAIKAHAASVPIAHWGPPIAFQADVTGAHASPLGLERLSVMKPGDRQTIVWMQGAEPAGLYCADEVDRDSLRICSQISEPLYARGADGIAPAPHLAESCTPNAQASVWTCELRQGVEFHDGSPLDAADVLATFAAQWDADHPFHVGRSGRFAAWADLFGEHLNGRAGR